MKILVASNDVSCLVDILKEKPILTPKLDPKSVQKWSQVGSKTVFEGSLKKIKFWLKTWPGWRPIIHQ